MVRLLVVEKDPIRQEGLLTCLLRETNFSLAGLGTDLVEALKNVSLPLPADVAIINMDQMESMRSWSILGLVLPGVRVVGLTEGSSKFILECALIMGAIVLLRPNVEPRVLCNAVRGAVKGVAHYDPYLVDRLKKLLMQAPKNKCTRIGELIIDKQAGEIRRLVKPVKLTPREKQVLALLCKGKSNRQIALSLNVKESTVAFHVSNVLNKLRVSSRVEAAIMGFFMEEDENGF